MAEMIPTNGLSRDENDSISCIAIEHYNERTTFELLSNYFKYRAQGMTTTQANLQVLKDMASYLGIEVAK